jgi:hypothetical protein
VRAVTVPVLRGGAGDERLRGDGSADEVGVPEVESGVEYRHRHAPAVPVRRGHLRRGQPPGRLVGIGEPRLRLGPYRDRVADGVVAALGLHRHDAAAAPRRHRHRRYRAGVDGYHRDPELGKIVASAAAACPTSNALTAKSRVLAMVDAPVTARSASAIAWSSPCTSSLSTTTYRLAVSIGLDMTVPPLRCAGSYSRCAGSYRWWEYRRGVVDACISHRNGCSLLMSHPHPRGRG